MDTITKSLLIDTKQRTYSSFNRKYSIQTEHLNEDSLVNHSKKSDTCINNEISMELDNKKYSSSQTQKFDKNLINILNLKENKREVKSETHTNTKTMNEKIVYQSSEKPINCILEKKHKLFDKVSLQSSDESCMYMRYQTNSIDLLTNEYILMD